MRRRSIPILFSVMALGLAFPLASARAAKIETTAPIKRFTLPSFTAAGQRSMLLRGEEARMVSADQIDIEGMLLNIYDPKDPETIQTVLTATSATYLNSTQIAQGKDGFVLKRKDVQMQGTRWTYTHKFKNLGRKVVIEGNVQVLFNSQIGNILK